MNYLYNGIELPDIPDHTYPYLYIGYNGTYWYFYCTPTEVKVSMDGYAIFVTAKRYIARDGEWVEGNYVGSTKIIWSNTDVYYSDSVEEVGGTLYLSASDPIPVNPAPTLDPTALLMCWQVGNRTRQRGGA